MESRTRTALLALSALLALPALDGCTLFFGDDDDDPCAVDGATELGIVFADETGDAQDLTEGAAVPLIGAPQGGFIILVAPRVRIASPSCQLLSRADLREPVSGRVLGGDQRLMLLRQRDDGWATPNDPVSLADVPNVPVCPTPVTTAIDGKPFQLAVQILDSTGRALAETSATIRPTCTNSFCRSNCSMN